jgi:PLP dependent protein
VIDPELSRTIADNLAAVRSRIERAAARSGRPASSVRLVAISKTFGPEHVRAAHAAGQVDFGENKVQEALEKREALTDLDLRWHLVGHLQSNKAKKAVGPFALIHSLDGADLLTRLDRAAGEAGRPVNTLTQADLAGESTKFGASPAELSSLFEAASRASHVRVVGLMLLPPWSDDPEASRPYFRRLRQLREELLARGIPPAMLVELSMGMSHDFEVAIEEGATLVRVGTAIFGPRSPGLGAH